MATTSKSKKYGDEYPISVDDAIRIIEMIPSRDRIKSTSKGREILYIPDIQRNGNFISILVNKSDKRIADPVFSDTKNHSRRIIEKEKDEGQDYSSHILLITNQYDPSQSIALVEHCQGLGISTIDAAFNSIIKLAQKQHPQEFTRPDPNGALDNKGNPVTHKVTHAFEFKGHPSKDLQEDIDNGTIRSIELISERNRKDNFDTNSFFEEKYRTISITPIDKNNLRNRIHNAIIRLLRSNKESYNKARIKFKTPQGLERSVVMDAINTSAQQYTKKEKIGNFNAELKGSYEKIHQPIIEKMKELTSESTHDQKPT
jgi:hypothetical protein